MILTGLARLGRDAELRTAGTDQVCNLSLAYNYGQKGADGNRPTQWVDAALWGRQAEALAPYLKKGGMVDVVVRDVRIETYQGRNGEGVKLSGTIMSIELAGGRQDSAQPSGQQPAPRQAQQPQSRPQPPADDGMDDDIPF